MPQSYFLERARLVPILICGLFPGCGGAPTGTTLTTESPSKTTAQEPAPPARSKETTKVYRLLGEVRGMGKKPGEVIIRHEAMPGFMDAMTMPFTLKDPALLEDVRPGDEVEGKIRVEYVGEQVRDYELEDLVVTKPGLSTAPPAAISLSPTLKPGDPLPDFEVTTQEGRRLRLGELRGQAVVLTFVYTRCPLPEYCPLMDRKFADLARLLDNNPERAKRVRLLSISFDPEHDTPEVLAQHAAGRGAHPPLWTYCVASHEELGRVAGSLGLVYGPTKDQIVHSLRTVLVGPGGDVVRIDEGAWSPSDYLRSITEALGARAAAETK